MPIHFKVLAVLMSSVVSAFVCAQNYPVRPVRIITGSTGSLGDIVSRQLAPRLSERWSQPVVVENRAGAGLTIGTAIAAKAPGDGYSLVMSDRTAIASAMSLYPNLAYDPVKDLSPITLVATTPMVLLAHTSVPASNLRELIAYTKQLPQGLSHATSGPGTVNHLEGELAKQVTGANLVAVHYKGGGAAMAAILSGEVKVGFNVPTIALPHLKSGKVKAYVTTGRNRLSAAPEIATVSEIGLPELESEYWIGMLVTARTSRALVQKLNHDLVETLAASAMRSVLLDQGAEPAYGSATQFAEFINSETRKWERVIRTAGIKPE